MGCGHSKTREPARLEAAPALLTAEPGDPALSAKQKAIVHKIDAEGAALVDMGAVEEPPQAVPDIENTDAVITPVPEEGETADQARQPISHRAELPVPSRQAVLKLQAVLQLPQVAGFGPSSAACVAQPAPGELLAARHSRVTTPPPPRPRRVEAEMAGIEPHATWAESKPRTTWSEVSWLRCCCSNMEVTGVQQPSEEMQEEGGISVTT
mmetsp:Transcript_57437/g.124239  ORF Transcript_57437/g.124239 Transcript_57437/m.124239 type:complete len:210 (-) Transcript_57437:63-692(-)